VLDVVLGALAVLTLVQILLRKQRKPVWTMKALTVTTGGALLTLLLAWTLASTSLPAPLWLPPIVCLQSGMLALAWLVLWPLDTHLKQRILSRGKTLRAAHPELLVIGITGSVGKTTTKELLAHILGTDRCLATPTHVNTEIGVAQWLLRTVKKPLPPQTPLIVEMGAYRPGEIATLCSVVRPSMGIVTFIGSQHLALFGSQESLAAAKGELLHALPANGKAFLNGDCDRCRSLLPLSSCPVTVVGTGGRADLEAYDIEETTQGLRFTADSIPFSVPLHGTHNVTNVLLAVAAAQSLGLKMEEIASRLRSFQPPHGTFEVRQERGVTILDDTHNASATSFSAAIRWAETQPFERKVLLTSGLIELGEEHERTHRELGNLAAPVFPEAIFLSRQSAALFAEGFGRPVTLYSRKTPAITSPALLVCVGRMPASVIRRLLPQ